FGSLRRFNDLFKNTYNRAPRDLRKQDGGIQPVAAGGIRLRLPYRAPYDWSGVIGFLRHRAIPGVEAVVSDSYTRVMRVGSEIGRFSMSQAPANDPALVASIELPSVTGLRATIERLQQMFDLRVAPEAVATQLGSWAMAGVRIPGAWD